MIESFETCWAFIKKWEGEYSNDPADPGGETRWGISKRTYPDLDIANLTEDECKAIFKKDYWDKCGCDRMIYPLDVVVADSAFNCGPYRALQWAEGNWRDVLFQRLAYYLAISDRNKSLRAFLRGWFNRVIDLYKTVGG